MAKILLVGGDVALLEGIAQTLVAMGHHPIIAGSIGEVADTVAGAPPLIAVVEHRLAAGSAEALRIPLAPGGALVLYRPAAAADVEQPLARAVQRLTLAELTLPLERQRLAALVQHVEERAVRAGRSGQSGHAAPGEDERHA